MISSSDEEDPWVFCDGRTMRRSEMRRLVAEDMARWARMDAERVKRMEAENEALREAIRQQRKAAWWAQWQRKFDYWQKLNQEARAEAYVEQRAESRRKHDEAMVDTLLARIAEKESAHRVACFNHNERLINGLTDHDYIEWMFACHEHRMLCPG